MVGTLGFFKCYGALYSKNQCSVESAPRRPGPAVRRGVGRYRDAATRHFTNGVGLHLRVQQGTASLLGRADESRGAFLSSAEPLDEQHRHAV